ncbi:MAG TPA: SDR family NAD(P)-dependent oxidoreductase [Gammaproteobacteria bacterium]|nr:SDR family NAD(P)-dependent oxidoreductase [Gammaproteobacteria bacterium]
MNMQDKIILITGANRGVGRALLEEALRRGASRIYAGTRGAFQHPDPRVTPVTLDVTNPGDIQRVASGIGALDLLINNAGIAQFDDLSDLEVMRRHMDVNIFGMARVTQALLPRLVHAKGAILNVLSLAALAPVPPTPSYSVSKAAAASFTQGWRMLLAKRGVTVHGVFLGPVDTDINRGMDIPKAAPADAAVAILDALERGEEDIFPDPMSAPLAASWRAGTVKLLEREFMAYLPPDAA